MKKQLLIFFFLLDLTVSAFAQERHGPYKIHKFVDGDTFWVMVNPGKPEKIRLIGDDTPEVKWERYNVRMQRVKNQRIIP